MTSNEYHIITEWRLKATVHEVANVLRQATDLARWWPSVYLDVQEIEPGDESGVGKVVRLYTKGWLPYTLRWMFRVTESSYPYGFALEAWGDLVGRGIWTLKPEEEWVHVIYDWKINADKLLLRTFSFLFKPIFSANHRWAMSMGEKSLELELMRRRATTPEERARIPLPPGPTFKSFIQRNVQI
jgi:hypothetical protein